MSIIFRAENLEKKYKNQYVLKNFNMEICKSDIYGFVGNNGAGKSTLMKIIMGLSYKTNGNIELFGESTKSGLIESRKFISGVIENPSFYPNFTGYQNLKLQQLAVNKKVTKREIEDALDSVGLEPKSNKKVKNYSLGMKQRLGVARALLMNSKFVILDEPTNGLDPSGMIELRKLIKTLNKEKEITFLISSHYISELSHIITKLGVVKNGSMVKEIDYEKLKEEIGESQEYLENYVMELAN